MSSHVQYQQKPSTAFIQTLRLGACAANHTTHPCRTCRDLQDEHKTPFMLNVDLPWGTVRNEFISVASLATVGGWPCQPFCQMRNLCRHVEQHSAHACFSKLA
jgi:hypothetical protein